MIVIIVFLWIFAGVQVISIIADGALGPRQTTLTVTSGGIVLRQILRILIIGVLAIAALGLAGAA